VAVPLAAVAFVPWTGLHTQLDGVSIIDKVAAPAAGGAAVTAPGTAAGAPGAAAGAEAAAAAGAAAAAAGGAAAAAAGAAAGAAGAAAGAWAGASGVASEQEKRRKRREERRLPGTHILTVLLTTHRVGLNSRDCQLATEPYSSFLHLKCEPGRIYGPALREGNLRQGPS
jgi:hypothetical protein